MLQIVALGPCSSSGGRCPRFYALLRAVFGVLQVLQDDRDLRHDAGIDRLDSVPLGRMQVLRPDQCGPVTRLPEEEVVLTGRLPSDPYHADLIAQKARTG